MKKRIAIICIVLVSAIAVIGGYSVFNSIFPKAEHIKYPTVENIVSASLSYNNEDEIAVSEGMFKELISGISKAEPTRKQSLNDYPTAEPFYVIAVKTQDREHRYFIYNEDTVYIEIPYEGIYLSTPEFLDFVSRYYESNKNYKTIKVTENSVSEIGREEFKLPVEITEDDANKLSQIINNDVWKEEPTECESDCVINLKGYWTYYDSNSGALNKYNFADMTSYSSSKQGIDGKSLVLSEEDKATVNAILEKYISLGITDIVTE